MLKEKLRGRKFNTNLEVISAEQGSLKQLPEKGFSTCFEKWAKRWTACLRERTLQKNDAEIYFLIFHDFTVSFMERPLYE